MLVEERHQLILEILDKENSIKIEDLKKNIAVSESTLRNDLRYLALQGKLKRSHGGAIKIQTDELPYKDRIEMNTDHKQSIGKKAAQWIGPEDTIILDAGTTIMELAKNLPTNFEFNVVTTGLNVAIQAGNYTNVSVHLVGGYLRPTLEELVGPKAIEGIRELNANKVFLGASGLDIKKGITEKHIFSAEVKREMIQSSNEIILLMDSSKIGKSLLSFVAPLSQVNVLITDNNIPEEYKSYLEELGIEVVIA